MLKYLIRLFGATATTSRSIALTEMVKLTRGGFYREAEALGVGFEMADLLPGKEPGIRAQLIDTRTADAEQPSSSLALDQPLSSMPSRRPLPPRSFAEHVVGMMEAGMESRHT
ncbi:MAG: hypothetical protein U0361_21165 [Nitrospiraceae bacterium]